MQSIWNLRAWCLQGCKRYRPCVVAVLKRRANMIRQPECEQIFLREWSPEDCRTQWNIRRYRIDWGRNVDADMACRMGWIYDRKYAFSYPKSYGGRSKAAESRPSVGQKSSRQGAMAAFDRRNGCQKCFCVTFDESNKAMCRIRHWLPLNREKG